MLERRARAAGAAGAAAAADLRYRRQAYELTVPMADGRSRARRLDALAAAFHDRHRQTYGHANPNESVQLVNLRLTALGRSPELVLRSTAAPAAPVRERARWFAETGFTPTRCIGATVSRRARR